MPVENNTSTQSAFSYLQYKNKVSGLVSGMDIDSIMEKLMKAESAQMEKLQQQKQKYEWKRDAYRDVNTKLSTFEKNIFTDYGLKGSWNMKNVGVSNDSLSAIATASANGTLDITEAKLATAGQKVVTMGGIETATGKLSDLNITSTDGKFSFKVDNGATQTISYSKDDTIESFTQKLNASGAFDAVVKNGELSIKPKGNVTTVDSEGPYSSTFASKLGFTMTGSSISGEAKRTIDTTTSGATITADSTVSSLGLSNGKFTIKAINEKGEYTTKEIAYKATDKISDVMTKINSSGVGVTAVVSGNQLSLTANTEGTGADGAINITSDNNGLFQKLGVLDGKTGDVTSGAGSKEGSSGYIVANGVKIEGKSNQYTVSGYQVTINKNINIGTDGNALKADDPNRVAGTKVSSTTDTDKIVDKVKKFVDSYNELIADLGKQTSEKKKTGYAPLTDAQKSEMTKDEIEKWEAAAKEGLLKGDTTINRVLSDMRSTLSNYGSGGEDMLAKIGITTSKSYKDNGKLEIDEDKLKAALSNDPDVVSRIFTGDGNGNDGIVSKMRTTAQNAVKTIQKTAGSATSESEATYSLGKTIMSLDNKIDDWKDRLKGIEERYWKQFSAMENAIQKANSQSSIFMQQ